MNTLQFDKIVSKAPFGLAYHKMVFDSKGVPVDYIFLNVNTAFEKMTGLKAKNILHKKVTEVIPEIVKDSFDWIGYYGNLVLNSETKVFEQYAEVQKKWFRVYVSVQDESHFTTIFTDVSQEHLIAQAAKELGQYTAENVNYKKITDYMRKISGADYVILNAFDSNGRDFTSVAASGIGKHFEKALSIFGFDIIGKKWPYDPAREAKIRDKQTTYFNNIGELIGKTFPKKIVQFLESSFNVGKTVLIKTTSDDLIVGDFTIIFGKNKGLENQILAESFADIVGATLNRINIENSLKTSEENWHKLFEEHKVINDNLTVGICVIDRYKKLVFANPKMKEWFPKSDEYNDIACYHVIYKKKINEICSDCPVDKTFNDGLTHKVEKKIRTELGERFFEITTSPLRNKKGEIIAAIEMMEDISERKKTEEAIIKSKEQIESISTQLESILDHLPALVFYKDTNNNFVRVNKYIADKYGKTKQELEGLSVFDLHDFKDAQSYFDDDLKVIRSGKAALNIEEKWLTNEGLKWISTSKIPHIDSNGDITGVIGISTDITERKAFEEKLKENENLLSLRIKLIEYAKMHSIDELLNSALDEICIMFNSPIGFYHFVDDDQNTISLQQWSTATKMSFCQATGHGLHYPIAQAGVWADCVKTKKPLIHNDYKSLPNKKGLPHGHAEVIRELVVPVLRRHKVVAILGIGNSPQEYKLKNAEQVSFIADVVYEIVEDKKAEEAINSYSKLQALLIKLSSEFINVQVGEIDNVIKNALQELGHFVNADRAYIFDYDWENEVCSNTFEWCAEGISAEIEALQQIPLSKLANWVETHKSNKEVVIYNVSALDAEDDIRKILEPQEIKSTIAFPMTNNEACVGFVGFDSVVKHHLYSENEKDLLRVFAQMLVNLKNRLTVYNLLNNQVKIQELITEISTDFVSVDEKNIDVKVNRMLKKAGSFFEVDRSYIFMFTDDNKFMSNTYEWCAEGISAQIMFNKNISTDIFSYWMEQINTLKILNIKDVDILPPELVYEKDYLVSQQVKSLLCVPISNNNRIIGFIGFDSVRQKKKWQENEIGFLKILANTLADATTKVNVEKELIAAKEIAEAASTAKSDFLSNMSHEIRTPLNGVIGFADLMQNSPLSVIQKQYVDNINTSAHSLLNIISDILDFSKIEAGKLELDLVKTDIIELCEQATDIVKYQASQKNLELLLNLPINMPRVALIDPVRLKQVLVNLLINGIKFTENGEVELKLDFEITTENKGKYTLSVRDSGIGISDKDRNKLFKAFSQADTSTTRKYGGTGLGLIISSHIAKQMGSEIKLISKPGKGSTFSFTFETTAYCASKPKEDEGLKIKNVLFIDDNEKNRTIIEHMLQHWGIHFTGCADGKSAIKIIEQSNPFDVIIVDYQMPVMDGLETIRIIRKILKSKKDNQPIILLHSSVDDNKVQKQCKELNVRFNIMKPVKSSSLYYYLKNIQEKKTIAINQSAFETSLYEKDKILFDNESPVILIAEDVYINLEVLKAIIKGIVPNVRIIEASNGYQVLDLLSKEIPDLIFMDIQMPELDGIETVKRIRKHKNKRIKNIPVVALTAFATLQEKEKCLHAGMNDFITKPVEKVALIKAFKKYLSSSATIKSEKTSEKKTTQKVAHFDKAKLIKMVGGDNDLVNEFMKFTLIQIPNLLDLMDVAIQSENKAELKNIAHTLRGTALNMCFENLAALLDKLEENVYTDWDSIGDLQEKIKNEWVVVKSLI